MCICTYQTGREEQFYGGAKSVSLGKTSVFCLGSEYLVIRLNTEAEDFGVMIWEKQGRSSENNGEKDIFSPLQ